VQPATPYLLDAMVTIAERSSQKDRNSKICKGEQRRNKLENGTSLPYGFKKKTKTKHSSINALIATADLLANAECPKRDYSR
jgi:hypothetical protein